MKFVSLLALALGAASLAQPPDPMPAKLAGSWTITRVLPTKNTACWDQSQAKPLLGSRLEYRTGAMHWRGGEVPLLGVVTRSVTSEEFVKESGSLGAPAFAELGIRVHSVTEIDLQHDDADITGATTEVPGDTVLIAAPSRIIVSACGVYFEAIRAGAAKAPTAHH